MKIKKTKNFVLIVLLVLTPWFNANYFDDIEPPNKAEGFTFYEINPCKISLFEFIYNNRDISNVQLVNDDYSSILCFGRVSQIKDGKTVFVGTNFLASSTYYVFFLVFLLRNKKSAKNLKLKTSYIHISYLCLLYTFLIFSDRKFYVTNFFFLDPFKFRTYVLIFIFLFLISVLLIEMYISKKHHIINLIPYSLLISGIVSNSNLNILSIPIVYLGIESLRLNKKYYKFFKIYMLFNCIWTLNARNTYILPENIYPGFSSTSYDFYSIFFYSTFFILFLLGSYKFVLDNINFFSYKKFMKSFSIVISVIIFLSIFGWKINVINFFTNFFNLQSKKNIIYFDFFNLLKIDERIIFLFIFIFLYKFLVTRSLETNDYLPLAIVFFILINFSNFLSVVKNKYNLAKDFFEIYNPTFLELTLGSGPINFNQLYVESNFQRILNHHLFITSLLLFFGLLGVLLFFLTMIKFYKNGFRNKGNLFFIFILSINFIFSDSMNYLPIFLIYILFFMVLRKESLDS